MQYCKKCKYFMSVEGKVYGYCMLNSKEPTGVNPTENTYCPMYHNPEEDI